MKKESVLSDLHFAEAYFSRTTGHPAPAFFICLVDIPPPAQEEVQRRGGGQ